MRSFQKCRGFTLVELLLYVAISSSILLVTSLFLQTLLESRIKNQTIAEVEQQGLMVMQSITQALRNAESVNSPTQGGTASTLSINTYIGANNPTVFDLSAGYLRVTEGVALPVTLTNSRVAVSALTVQNLSKVNTPGTVRLQFTISHQNSSGRNEYSFSKTFISSASLRHP